MPAFGSARGGSSPRVRGTRECDIKITVDARFIPACAGNTSCRSGRTRASTVHPRVCGEHRFALCGSWCASGSSPRVRGTPRRRGVERGVLRFIPACAGNTRVSPRRVRRTAVHPRVCGEHPLQRREAVLQRGSSPRVRGTRDVEWWDDAASDFIPACAGNTRSTTISLRKFAGSSPRVRGTQHQRRQPGDNFRFIPACAGNTIQP